MNTSLFEESHLHGDRSLLLFRFARPLSGKVRLGVAAGDATGVVSVDAAMADA